MKNFRRAATACGLAVTALLAAPAAQAYDELVVFGDSLSDNGNIYRAAFGFLPTAPYYQGRFSNGPVAVEVMAGKLGIPLVDYAYGGASTGRDNEYLPRSNSGIRGQIDAYLADLPAGKADAADLYVVSGGGNDLLAPIRSGLPVDTAALVDATVQNLAGDVLALYAAGARDVMVPLLPDLGTTYYGTSGSMSAEMLTGVSSAFNLALRQRMDALKGDSPGLTLRIFNTGAVLADFRQALADAGGNVTDRCWTGDLQGKGGTLCADPDKYYLFDSLHPTAIVHREIGERMAAAVAVPEPQTLALLLGGLAVVGWRVAGRRKDAPVAEVRAA